MSNLQEFHDLLKDEFPKVESKKLYKILFSIQARLRDFWDIGFSRYEYDKFQVSEKTLRNIIEYLRAFWILEFSHTTMSTKKARILNRDFQKCNVYKVSEDFKEMIESFVRFCKKTFEYLDPIVFMKRYTQYIEKRLYYSFKIAWVKYKIHKWWPFKWKIFDCANCKIINPYDLL